MTTRKEGFRSALCGGGPYKNKMVCQIGRAPRRVNNLLSGQSDIGNELNMNDIQKHDIISKNQDLKVDGNPSDKIEFFSHFLDLKFYINLIKIHIHFLLNRDIEILKIGLILKLNHLRKIFFINITVIRHKKTITT